MRALHHVESVATLPSRRMAMLGATGAVAVNALLVLIHNTLRTSYAATGRVFVYLLLSMGIVVVAGVYRALEDDWLLPGILLAGFALATEVNLMILDPHLWGSLGLLGAVTLDVVGIVSGALIGYLRFSRRRQMATVHQFPSTPPAASHRHAA